MKFLPYDKPNFLEPAHDHNPADVSNLTDLPPSCSGRLPAEIRELLPAVQEATSIVFASLNRLDDLLSQRLDRLTILSEDGTKPGVGNIQCKWPILHRLVFIPQVQFCRVLKDLLGRLRTSLSLVSKPGEK